MIKVLMKGENYTVTAKCEAMDFNHNEGTATFYYDDMVFTIPIDQLRYIQEEEEEEGE